MPLGERRQQPRPGLDQYDAGGARIDAAEVALERLPRHLGDGARHLDARGSPADNDEREELAALLVVISQLRLLESGQDAAPDAGCVFDAF